MSLELPVHKPDHDDAARPVAEVRGMAVAVQANLVQLKVADAKRRGLAPDAHDIRVPAPGAVKRFRETLIDPATIDAYTDFELAMRLREYWGRFCLLRWLFSVPDSEEGVTLARLPVSAEMHCGAAVEIKHAELHGLLWRIQFESRVRHDAAFAASPERARFAELAARIPAEALGRAIRECTDEVVLLAACEFAGMLATLRWVMDRTRDWSDPNLMAVDAEPF